jgi:glycerol-3-phosphate acyltransferase PlsY
VTSIRIFEMVLAYLLGSIPSAYLAGRWVRGIDIRRHGSGNVGATNVFRVLGPGPGAAVLIADAAKGSAAVLLPLLLERPDSVWDRLAAAFHGADPLWPCVLGLVAVLGHSYTVFLGFKGGKGVATSLGVFLALAPLGTLSAVAVFAAVLAASRMVSAGSLAAAFALPPALLVFKEWRPAGQGPADWGGLECGWGATERPVFWLGVALALLVWVRHIPNIKRILNGTENRFGSKKGGQA